MPIDINLLSERLARIYGQCWSHADNHPIDTWMKMKESSAGVVTVSLYTSNGDRALGLLDVFSESPIFTREFIDSFVNVMKSMSLHEKFRVRLTNHSEDWSVLASITKKGDWELIDSGPYMRIFGMKEHTDHCLRSVVSVQP